MIKEPPPLWDWLYALPFSSGAQIVIALLMSGFLGVLWHYACQWQKGYISGCLGTYLFRTNAKGTLSSVMTLLAAVAAMSGFDAFYREGSFIGWWAVISSGFSMGLLADVTFNKGERETWTQSEREAKRATE